MHVLSYAGSYLSLSLTGTAEGIKDEVITFPFIILLIFYAQRFDLGIFSCMACQLSFIRFITL